MNKSTIILAALAIVILGGCAGSKKAKSYQELYFPYKFRNIEIGMSKAAFEKARPNAKNTESGGMNFRELMYEDINDGEFGQVIYYFDAEGSKPFYEMIIVMAEGTDVELYAEKLLGKPNFEGKEWKFPIADDYNLRAWTYDGKLIFGANYPGTEWEGEEGW